MDHAGSRLVEPGIVAKNQERCRHLVRTAIRTFDLNLSGLTVLTEAATGYYTLTPLIAALSGAEHVYALTRNSAYGRANEVRKMSMALAEQWGVSDRVEVILSRRDERIGRADIVTNLGFVRPLDRAFLRRLKPTAVIPLMFETWEYRLQDLDLSECKRLGIPVLGTNEHHANLKLICYVGLLALKLLLELEIEIFRSTLMVIGSGEFAQEVIRTLRAAKARVIPLFTGSKGQLRSHKGRSMFQEAEAAVIVEHHNHRPLIGREGEIGAKELFALNPTLAIAHICGGVDREALEAVGFRCHPRVFAPPGYMSVTTDYLGPRPLIDLHTAGLKVGEELARARRRGLSRKAAERFVLEQTSLAQGFNTMPRRKGQE